MKVRLISFSSLSEEMKAELPPELHSADGLMAYCARVSSAKQDNPNYSGLLKFCASHGHWSVFSMADMCVEITTSRAISAQILRHKSLDFQEFSQRYQEVNSFETYEARSQDVKNRQNSIDNMSRDDQAWFHQAQLVIQEAAQGLYEEAITKNIAKEQARFLLPMAATTKLYVKGNVRSWIHYLKARTDPATQKEHREIAEAIKVEFIKLFPITAKSLDWA